MTFVWSEKLGGDTHRRSHPAERELDAGWSLWQKRNSLVENGVYKEKITVCLPVILLPLCLWSVRGICYYTFEV